MSMFMLGAVDSLIPDAQYALCVVETMSCYACQFFLLILHCVCCMHYLTYIRAISYKNHVCQMVEKVTILITALTARSIKSTITAIVLSLRLRAFRLPPPTSCFGISILCSMTFDDRVCLQLQQIE